MSSIWKIIIGIIVIAIIGFGIAVYWAYNKMTSLEELTIDKQATLAEKVKATDAWLEKIHKGNKFNGAVLVIKNDSVLIKNTYGYKDYNRTKKLDNNSSFRLASISKQFTAVGIMLLKEQGKLNFDDSITKFLPDLPYKKITVRNLLNHTSGIPDIYMDFPKKYKNEVGEVLTISKMIDLLAKENKPLIYPPNDEYQYNNTGYVLLAGIIEKVSGRSYEEFMQTELFDKLKMKNTRVWNLVSTDKSFENKTSSFENVLGNITELKPGILDGVAGDGAVFSSINDFIIWNQFWYDSDLLSEETKKEAFKKPILNNGEESDYGFGWIIHNKFAHSHNGSWLGASTLIVRNEQLKNCMVILDNSASLNVDAIGNHIVKALK